MTLALSGSSIRLVAATLVMMLAMPGFSGDDAYPIVPGFERFHAVADGDPVAGGQLLVGELNCTACHAASDSVAKWIVPKPAPNLDLVAARVKPAYLRRFLADPQSVDPGTTMPQLFVGLAHEERDAQIEPLVHFLASGGNVEEMRSDRAAVRRGEGLFHTQGCAVCHGPRKPDTAVPPDAVTLGDLGSKYAIPGLAAFLMKPHEVRPGGRMPSLDLDAKQARDIAHFLIPDANPRPASPRLAYKVYEGSYGSLPDFAALTPDGEGTIDGFDVSVAGQEQNVAIVFEGFLKIEKPGEYWFRIGSDDGSKLFIDDELVANNDGVHAYASVRGARTLKPGVHRLRVEYAQVAGEMKLSVQFEGPEVASQSVVNFVYLTEEAKPPEPTTTKDAKPDGPFVVDAALAQRGREFFASLGCANCHAKSENGTRIASTKTAPGLAAVRPGRGCLSAVPATPAVDFRLNEKQVRSIASALETEPDEPPTTSEQVEAALVRFNCYACHERAGRGGVQPDRNELFTTTVPEMGDEGRIPPHLTGIGDKLKVDWMRHLLGEGADDRTYMRTRMPNFGSENVGFLAQAFADLDARTEATVPKIDLPPHRVASTGRELVGESALSCIKCHNFGEHSGTGIQAINLLTMTRRLRQDWFVRYMPDPQEYRPGTRMPSAFPNGKSVVRGVLDGDAGQQLAAIWEYLELGSKAPIPAGVVTSAIVLTPTKRPIVYRNFLDGLSSRGIAVGYPEQANLAFDADRMNLTLIWHNAFLDASKHWAGRGSGTQGPLGDHVLRLVSGVPLAVLPDDGAAWPVEAAKNSGWRFEGYRLDPQGYPSFRYGTAAFVVEDTPRPIDAKTAGTLDAVLHREFVVRAPEGGSLPERLYFRAAAGQSIESVGGRNYRIDGALTLRFSAHPDATAPLIREVDGHKELLVPLRGASETVEIDYEW